MATHYQALADKAAHNAAYAETDRDFEYWKQWAIYYTDMALAAQACGEK